MQIDYKSRLSPKRVQFCLEYLQDFNGQKAAERARYAPKSARVTASRLLTNDNVLGYLQQLQGELIKTAKLSALEVTAESKKIGFCSIGQLLDKGRLKKPSELSPEALSVISKIKETPVFSADGKRLLGRAYEYEMFNKLGGLHQLHRVLGSYAETSIKLKTDEKYVNIFKNADSSRLQARYKKLRDRKPGAEGKTPEQVEVEQLRDKLAKEVEKQKNLNEKKERMLKTIEERLAEAD